MSRRRDDRPQHAEATRQRLAEVLAFLLRLREERDGLDRLRGGEPPAPERVR